MEICKYRLEEKDKDLFIGNDDNGFIICYGGSDFYWITLDYEKCSKFLISKKDKYLYSIFINLFKKIEKNDDKDRPTIRNNVFEWISEARQPEISNKLVISKEEDEFVVEFIKNPMDYVAGQMCAISFCLSGSRNAQIVFEFVKMYQDYMLGRTSDNGCQKTFKNKNNL